MVANPAARADEVDSSRCCYTFSGFILEVPRPAHPIPVLSSVSSSKQVGKSPQSHGPPSWGIAVVIYLKLMTL